MTISLSIAHSPWRPERVTSLERLKTQLANGDPHSYWDGPHQLMTDRAPNHVWSETMWKHAVEIGADWSLFLQDDVVVAPNFRGWLDAMIAAVPDVVIGLEAVHHATPLLARAGHRWYTTRDGLVGVGYMLPTTLLADFLKWRATELKPGWQEHLTAQRTGEDTLLGLWCLVTGTRIWHPLPTPIDHDTSMPSTYGNDNHRARRPLVRFDNTPAIDGTKTSSWEHADVPHLGIFPGWHLPMLARREVIGYDDARARADMADDGRSVVVPMLPTSGVCWSCLDQPAEATTHVTGAAFCRPCIVQVIAAMIGARP